MKLLVKSLQVAAFGLGTVLLFVAVAIAGPFACAGLFCLARADDLEGEFRNGRRQNRLWQWARKYRT